MRADAEQWFQVGVASRYEQDKFDAGIAEAITGLWGADRLDAALWFVVNFQSVHSSNTLVHNEPQHVLAQMRRVLPIMRDRICREISGSDPEIVASAIVRIAVCHYLVQQLNSWLPPPRVQAG